MRAGGELFQGGKQASRGVHPRGSLILRATSHSLNGRRNAVDLGSNHDATVTNRSDGSPGSKRLTTKARRSLRNTKEYKGKRSAKKLATSPDLPVHLRTFLFLGASSCPSCLGGSSCAPLRRIARPRLFDGLKKLVRFLADLLHRRIEVVVGTRLRVVRPHDDDDVRSLRQFHQRPLSQQPRQLARLERH
jgi:hypothetical protein